MSGLHFSQDGMREFERNMLHVAERMLGRCDSVLAIHRAIKKESPAMRFSDSSMPGVDWVPDYTKPPEVSYSCDICQVAYPCPTSRAIIGEFNV